MENEKQLSIICFSGDFDRAVAAFTLATGAAAVNYKVSVFFTFWGLNLIKKHRGRRFLGRGFLPSIFGFLQGGLKNVPLSRLNIANISPRLMRSMMKRRNVATLEELVEAAIALNIDLYACEMSMNILGLVLQDYIPQIKEVIGVSKFLDYSKGGETLFI